MKIDIIIAFLAGVAASAVFFLLFNEKDEEKAEENKKAEDIKETVDDASSDINSHLERAREVAIKAELASEAKSRFIAYITHEIRTCLNIIMGITQIFEEEKKDGISEKQKNFISTIADSSKKLLSVTDEVSEFSTREKSDRHFFIKEKVIDLKKLCSEIVNDIRPVAQNKNLNLTLSFADTVPDTVAADRTKLSHLLYTTIENAIRFTNKGAVSLTVKNFFDASQKDKPMFLFTIQDSGSGISEQKLSRIFDFTDEDVSVAERTGNVKLGLAVCKYLAETMGGSIKVESKKNDGTTFSITLPLRAAKVEELKSESFVPGTRKSISFVGKKALLAEDDPINRQIEKLLLQKYGFSIETVSNGQEAVQKYKNNKYDIIFMDCEMPIMNGFSASREIRAIEEGADKDKKVHTPIIAMTANAMVGDKEMCIESGMDDYISKPVNIDKLVEATSKYLT